MVLQFLKVIPSVGFRLLRCNYNAAYCQVQQLHTTLWHHHSQLYIYAIKIKIKMYTLQHCGTGCSQYTVKLHTSSLCTQITHYHSRHIYMHKLFITFHAVSLMENFCCCSCIIKKIVIFLVLLMKVIGKRPYFHSYQMLQSIKSQAQTSNKFWFLL